jgi:hypothetical protein
MGKVDHAEQARRDAIAAGEPHAYGELARFLEEHERDTEAEQAWRDSMAAAEQYVLGGLADLLKRLGRTEEARQIEEYGLNPDGSIGSPPSLPFRRRLLPTRANIFAVMAIFFAAAPFSTRANCRQRSIARSI